MTTDPIAEARRLSAVVRRGREAIPARDRAIRALYVEGAGLPVIREVTGLSRYSVHQILRAKPDKVQS